jgi:aryl-alcohol dehydrogenase-like predicted oxidoreductase
VIAPIASARTAEQLPDLVRITDVRLSNAELQRLNQASAAANPK